MSIAITNDLQSMTLAQLAAHYNELPGVSPVKKFASKEAAIKRIEAAIATQNEVVEEDTTDPSMPMGENGNTLVETLDDYVPTFEESHPGEELPVEGDEGGEATNESAEDTEASEESPAPGGFKYLTRDELAALAESDPAARQAYRMARRKAARMARKAKKGKAE